MDAYDFAQVIQRSREADRLSLEFHRYDTVSLSVYRLPAGATDPQQPHSEDEAYYVVRGRAVFRAGDEEQPVAPGAVLAVRAGVPHRFHSIAEDLELLVIFAPAKGTQAG